MLWFKSLKAICINNMSDSLHFWIHITKYVGKIFTSYPIISQGPSSHPEKASFSASFAIKETISKTSGDRNNQYLFLAHIAGWHLQVCCCSSMCVQVLEFRLNERPLFGENHLNGRQNNQERVEVYDAQWWHTSQLLTFHCLNYITLQAQSQYSDDIVNSVFKEA